MLSPVASALKSPPLRDLCALLFNPIRVRWASIRGFSTPDKSGQKPTPLCRCAHVSTISIRTLFICPDELTPNYSLRCRTKIELPIELRFLRN